MVNCQFPASCPAICGELDPLPPHADKSKAIGSSSKTVHMARESRVDVLDRLQSTAQPDFDRVISALLKRVLQTELHDSGKMRIQRMQERGAGYAIRASARLKARGIERSGIATDHIVSAALRIVRVVDSKFGVIENVEELCPKLELTAFCHFEMLQQRHVKVQAAGIVQEVSSRISEGQAARGDKLGRISQQWSEALQTVRRRRQAVYYIRIGSSNA